MSAVTKVEVSEVYIHERRGVVVKHFRRSDQAVTMCGKRLHGLGRPESINRVCVVCDRWRRLFAEEQARELQLLAQWNGSTAGQDSPAPASESCPRPGSVGCAFGSVVEVPDDER